MIGPDLLPYERSVGDPGGTPLVAPAPDHAARHGKVVVPVSRAVPVAPEPARAVPAGPPHPPRAPQQPAAAPAPPAATPAPAPEPLIHTHRPRRRRRVWWSPAPS